MISLPLEKIDKAAIESLITNSVPESRTLEYKERLPGNSEQDKHEFLADMTAIANASGGDLVYGIKEKRDAENKSTGEPQEACGVGLQNLDERNSAIGKPASQWSRSENTGAAVPSS